MLSEDGVVGGTPNTPTNVMSRDICPHVLWDFLDINPCGANAGLSNILCALFGLVRIWVATKKTEALSLEALKDPVLSGKRQ